MKSSIKSLSKKITSSHAFKVATRIGFLLAPQLVLMAFGVYDQVAHAQGLVGAPVDPRYGQSNEVGQLADYGYDTARDISRAVTALSLIVSVVIFPWMIRRRKPKDGLRILRGLAFAIGIPITVHLVGTFLINNFGGLGGGL